MQERWKFKSENDLKNAVQMAFETRKFHPVRDYLQGLHWDGEKRLDTVFIRHMGADDTAFVRAATRKWFCAAVARVMRPGTKFDNCIILIGSQGIGKSSFASILSRGWFTDSFICMDNKDGYMALHGKWIVELAELASTKRSEVESVKTFISKSEDSFRPAYGKNEVTYLRQCVFFGTTNDQECLRDRTGNRRFWPISVEKSLDRDAFSEEVDQLWAEAYELWKSGTERLYLDTEELQTALEEEQESRIIQDDQSGMEEEVLAYLDTPLPGNWDELSKETKRDFIQGTLPGVNPDTCTGRRDVVSLSEMRYEMYGYDSSERNDSGMTFKKLAYTMRSMRDWRKSKKKVRIGDKISFLYYRKGSEADRLAKKDGK